MLHKNMYTINSAVCMASVHCLASIKSTHPNLMKAQHKLSEERRRLRIETSSTCAGDGERDV